RIAKLDVAIRAARDVALAERAPELAQVRALAALVDQEHHLHAPQRLDGLHREMVGVARADADGKDLSHGPSARLPCRASPVHALAGQGPAHARGAPARCFCDCFAEAPGYAGRPTMVNQNVMRRGFCPGVWAPMSSGDGLLVRARARRGRLDAQQIRGLAGATRAFGNGIVELTRRANLQLRGASARTLPDLQAELVRLQLASESPRAERQPALFVDPLAGLHANCPPLEPVADALEALLARPELTSALSEKFSLLLGGESDLFGELEVDVRVQLSRSAPGWA